MALQIIDGQFTWRLSEDDDSHRDYFISHLVRSTLTKAQVNAGARREGPRAVHDLGTLPQTGDSWNFDGDVDNWAFCLPRKSISKVNTILDGSQVKVWKVDQVFSTRPIFRCQDEEIEDPLLEPQKVSGNFTKFTVAATKDRNGNLIENSAHEPYKAALVEFDANRPAVRVSQNVYPLGLSVFAPMVDTLNDATLWGLASRRIKLSNVTWEEKFFGVCGRYYTRIFDFDVQFNTFDRDLPDKGTMKLKDGGDVTDPTDFIVAKDDNDENYQEILLNGSGAPLTAGGSPIFNTIEVYDESNFLLLGIPTILGI